MNRCKYIWHGFVNYFLRTPLLCFVVIQFTVIFYYLEGLRHFCKAAGQAATPYALPFMAGDYYFVVIYGLCCVYFFSGVPFLQSGQLYPLMRMGRKRWMMDKLLRIWLSATGLVCLEVLMLALVLMPWIEWSAKWGKIWYSLALTDAGYQYGVNVTVPYEIVNDYQPLQAMAYTSCLMLLLTALLGMLMFAWSLYFGRSSAIFVGCSVCVMTLVFANLSDMVRGIAFAAPMEWMNLMLLDGRICSIHPDLRWVVRGILVCGLILVSLCICRIDHIDISLEKEE